MHTYIIKLRHILPAFLIIAVSTVLGLSFVRWLLAIHFELVDIKEEVWEIWLPMALPWIPVLIWLRPKFRILTFKDNDNGRIYFQLVAAGAITASLMVAQNYLSTATGKLERVNAVSQIATTKKARYYTINHFEVAQSFSGSYTDFRTSGKYNNYLNFDIYFVCPIVSDTSERIPETPKYWYGVKFHEQISNKINNEEKEKKYNIFYKECLRKMDKYQFHSSQYFERVPTSDDKEGYLKAAEARIKQPITKNTVILQPKFEPFEARNGNQFAWIFGSFGIGLSILLFSLIWPSYSKVEHLRQLAGKKPKQDDLVDALKYLIPQGSHFATTIILDLNLLVFLLMIFSGIHVFSPNGIELLEWGANRRAETTGGEWWRLLTSMFLHGGLMHLVSNIFGLVMAAIFVEPLLGRNKYLILYLLAGLCGSLTSIWWYENTISVGASGSIFGLYGAVLGLLLTNAFPRYEKKGILILIGIYVVFNLVWGLTGGIDNAAHIGGLLSGVVIGIMLYSFDKKETNAS
ncbi:MAG: rhomboid family intramembrane serine protease [Phycisphaerae bacterium]|nr:rhomboid family intramembrane serine protease [Saprospiraceae bacterium]